MYQSLEIFKMAQAMAVHAGDRQALVAQNVANADTPGYKPLDLPKFADSYAVDSKTQRATRAGHLHGTTALSASEAGEATTVGGSPNGNGVSIEEEMLRAVEIKRQHGRALAIYKSSLGILRTSLGRS